MKAKIFGYMWAMVMFAILPSAANEYKVDDTVLWSSQQKLSWNDFKAAPDYAQYRIAALSQSGIMHYKYCKDGYLQFQVRAYFEKQNSWVRPESRTPSYLSHEQLHFDITELYTRKILKALEEKGLTCEQGADFEKLIQSYLVKWRLAQMNYDLETSHSNNKEAQKEWSEHIQYELSKYQKYAPESF